MTTQLLGRVLVLWLGFMTLAILNGGLREKILIPMMGDAVAQGLSTLMGCGLILLATWIAWPWLGIGTWNTVWWAGVIWLGLTVAFEFLAGHYLFHTSWRELLDAYNLAQGRTWIFVLLVTLLAPAFTFYLRGASPT